MDQIRKQKLIELSQSPHASTVIEIIKDCIPQNVLVGDNEFETVRNAVIFDTYQNMIVSVVKYLEDIRQGALHNNE